MVEEGGRRSILTDAGRAFLAGLGIAADRLAGGAGRCRAPVSTGANGDRIWAARSARPCSN